MSDHPKYELSVYWSAEDSVFVAEVPDLPGCLAHGETAEEAVRQVEQAIDLWIDSARADGVHVPVPRLRAASTR